jgi:ubiquitin-hydrolase Zn-finger-containing protein
MGITVRGTLAGVTQADEVRDRPLGLFRRLVRAGGATVSPKQCEHLDKAPEDIQARTPGRCEEHTDEDGWVVHLRMCLTCGHVGCCDSSRPRHATRHFEQTGHPVMRSVEAGESWRWCYVDELLG